MGWNGQMRIGATRIATWICLIVMALTGLFATGCYVHTRGRGQRVYIRDGGHNHGRVQVRSRGRGHDRGRGRGHGHHDD